MNPRVSLTEWEKRDQKYLHSKFHVAQFFFSLFLPFFISLRFVIDVVMNNEYSALVFGLAIVWELTLGIFNALFFLVDPIFQLSLSNRMELYFFAYSFSFTHERRTLLCVE